MPNTRITEIKTVDIKRPTCANPIFLAFHFEEGGTDYWLFEGNKKVENIDSGHQTFTSAYEDLETTSQVTGTIRKDRVKRYVVQANHLTTQQYNGLINAISSTKVELLMNPSAWETDGPVWQTVFIASGTNTTEDREGLKTITMTIVLQPVLTVSA